MNKAPLLTILFSLASLPLAQAGELPLNFSGKWVQSGTCQCDASLNAACDDNRPGLLAFTKLFPYALAKTARKVTDESGESRYLNMWIVGAGRPDGRQLIIVDGQNIQITLTKTGPRALQISAENLSEPQDPYVLQMKLPENQAGGEPNGPALYEVSDNGTHLIAKNLLQRRFSSITPIGTRKEGIVRTERLFEMERLSDSRMAVSFSRNDSQLLDGTISYEPWDRDFIRCEFERKD